MMHACTLHDVRNDSDMLGSGNIGLYLGEKGILYPVPVLSKLFTELVDAVLLGGK